MNGWMPIETAPMDGTWLLTFQPSQASLPIAILRWDEDAGKAGLWVDGDGGWFVIAPTHWMPLPIPPCDSGSDPQGEDGLPAECVASQSGAVSASRKG